MARFTLPQDLDYLAEEMGLTAGMTLQEMPLEELVCIPEQARRHGQRVLGLLVLLLMEVYDQPLSRVAQLCGWRQARRHKLLHIACQAERQRFAQERFLLTGVVPKGGLPVAPCLSEQASLRSLIHPPDNAPIM